MEMLHGFLHGAAMFTAIGECPGNTYSAHRVKPAIFPSRVSGTLPRF